MKSRSTIYYFLLMTQINAGLGSLIKANIIDIYILLMEIRSGKGRKLC